MSLFINTIIENPQFGIPWLLVVIFSICCHEYAHAWTAVKCGDDTPLLTGHLTLNPFRQMGAVSLFMLIFIGIAWGAVPVDRAKLGSRRNRILTAAAGPLTNIILGAVSFLFLTASIYFQWNERAISVFIIGSGLNMALFVFNILPVPPLDGFTIIREIFPRLRMAASQTAAGIFLFLMVLCFIFSGKILDFCFYVVYLAAEEIFAVWL